MLWQYVSLLFLSTIISTVLSLYAWRRRSVAGAATLALLMLAVAQWSFGYTMELVSPQLSAKIFWAKVEYVGIATLPLAWLAFALQYTNRGRWLSLRNVALLAVVPVLTILLNWTNEFHGLIWQSTRLDNSNPFLALEVTYGGWFWVHLVYSYVLLLAGTIFLIQMLMRSSHTYRWQSVVLLVGTLLPWVGNGLYLLRLSPIPNLDLTPFTFTLSGVAIVWGVFRFKLLDLVPIARRAVVDSMSDGVIVLDPQNRVVDLNPAAQQIIGRRASEAIGQPANQVLAHWPDLADHFPWPEGTHIEIDLAPTGAKQQHFDLRVSTLYNRRNKLTGRVVILRDITQRKQAEEALMMARDRAIEASQLKTELLAKVSHELRTPLGAILGYAEMLQEGVYGPITQQQQISIQEIVTSARHLTTLVNELLDQAQLDAGKLRLNITSFAPAELITQIHPQMNTLARAKGLNLVHNIAADLPPTITGDPARLQQILINLVGNAIKFTRQGTIQIALYRPDTIHWAMQVSDTGPGIPPEAQSYIFEPFGQVDGSITREYTGTGLGLSIVKQLAHLMGGEISLESDLGQGSRFTVLLPIEPNSGGPNDNHA